jgi:hypothetical protein
MKKAYYFSHDSNAKTDEKILNLRAELGWEGYGIYWALIETLHDSTENKFPLKSLNGLSINLGVKRIKIEKIIHDYGLFKSDENFFWSESLIKRMKIKEEKSWKARKAAKKRWESEDANAMQTHSESNANAMQTHSESNALKERKGKERKRKESKGKESKGKESKGKESKGKESKDDDASNEAPPESVFKNFISVYDEFIKIKTNCPAKIDGVQGKAAKSIIDYLRRASNDKSDEGVINSWKFLLSKWDKIEPFYQQKLKLNEIESNIVNIIGQIKNGYGSAKQNSKGGEWDNFITQRTGADY